MISRAAFAAMVSEMERQISRDNRISKSIESITSDGFAIYTTELTDHLVTILDQELETDMVSWYISERTVKPNKTLFVTDPDGTRMTVGHGGELYDVIIKYKIE